MIKAIRNFFVETWNILKSIFFIFGMDYSFVKWTIVFFGIRFFFIDYSMVPSCSMTPTARTGDIVILNKNAYGLSSQNIHIPFLFFPKFYMLSKSKINLLYVFYKMFPNVSFFDIKPKRGDLCTFILSRDPKMIYFKRIVAIGGDKVQMKEGVLHVNGISVKMEKIENFEFLDDHTFEKIKGIKYKITLANGFSYEILRNCEIGQHPHDNTIEYIVPKNHVWVQGDFNTGSADSFEYDYTGGSIPIENLLGRPFFVICGTNARDEKNPNLISWFITLPIRIPRYIYNLDFSRCFKGLK